jgi:hypothetical protein
VPATLSSRFSALPRPVATLLAALVTLGILTACFFAVIFPLIDNTGPVTAEVDGVISARGAVGRPLTLQLSIVSTGDQTIAPLCVQTSFSQPVDFVSVTFQGIETIPARGNTTCGGQLATQETTSIAVHLLPRAAGTISMSIKPTERTKVIGIPLTGTLHVSP